MLPTEITIAGINYAVIEKENVIVNGKSDMAGCHSITESTIEIWKDGSIQYKELVLAHEILHGFAKAVNYKGEEEEQIMLSFERVFYQFLKDNTDFYRAKGGIIKSDVPVRI